MRATQGVRCAFVKILVSVKRVIDYHVHIRVKADGSGVETDNVAMSMNPFDDIAVEEAVRLKEQNPDIEIIVVSIGDQRCEETLRQALAMGADRALLIETEQSLEPLHVAQVLQQIVNQEKPELIFLGKQAIDDDCNQSAQMLAGLLNCAQATFASKVVLENDFVEVTRETDSGLQTIKVSLPAVISTDLRLNEPRFASLPNIMKAKQKPLENVSLSSLNLNLSTHVQTQHIEPPAKREGGVMVETFAELIDKLKNEAKVLP